MYVSCEHLFLCCSSSWFHCGLTSVYVVVDMYLRSCDVLGEGGVVVV
jgi:hypothetical protein